MMTQPKELPTYSICWADANQRIGLLTWDDGILKFEGSAEQSAIEFLKYLAQHSGFELTMLTAKDKVNIKLLPDENPTQFDYLHAIRAVAARIGNKQIFDLADAGMSLPTRNEDNPGG